MLLRPASGLSVPSRPRRRTIWSDQVPPEGTAALHERRRPRIRPRFAAVDLLHPVRPTPQRPSRQQRLFLGRTVSPAMQTGPTPAFRPRGTSPARRPLDIPTNREEVLVVLHRKGFEAALVKVAAAGTVAVSVPALRVGKGQPAREAGQVPRLPAPDHQMPMAGERAIRQEPGLRPFHGLFEHPLECRVILPASKIVMRALARLRT